MIDPRPVVQLGPSDWASVRYALELLTDETTPDRRLPPDRARWLADRIDEQVSAMLEPAV